VINDVTFKIIQQKAEDDIEISLQFETQVRKYITIFEYPEDNDKLIQKKNKNPITYHNLLNYQPNNRLT